MGEQNLPNINPATLLAEATAKPVAQKTTGYNEKNYLNVMLDKGQKSKTLTIRLLPMDLATGNPFIKAHYHNVKVPKEISQYGFKSYLCLSKNEEINHEKFGNKCPFCELRKSAYEAAQKETDEVTKKEYIKLSVENIPKEAVIVRCIERGKEDEGVKFWKFYIRKDQTDPYNQILNLWKLRMEEGQRNGVNLNILDIYNGVDLTVTVTEGNAAPTIVDGRIQCPVSRDEEELKRWIFDEKKWQDVFTAKPYEYLKLISEMKVPYYDKNVGKWVDKEEYMQDREQMKHNVNDAITNADSEVLESVGQNIMTNLTVQDNMPF